MTTPIRLLALLCLLAIGCSANVASDPADGEPVCGSAAEAPAMLNSGCDPRERSYVVTCSGAVPNPGLEGECQPPPVGPYAIVGELDGKAPVWCCR